VDPYLEKIDLILKKNLTEKTFNFWTILKNGISNPCWDKPTSSTKKYHRKENGRVPSVAEHTFEMLYAADKIVSMFEGLINKDVIFLSIVLHDCYKYGLCKTCQWTEEKHGQITADKIINNKSKFLYILTENEISSLQESIRYHDGKWATDAKSNKSFNISYFTPEIMFLHTLDMMSSRNLIKVVEEKNAIINN
jgi:23S rRNA maturation-related 3'-5' exoribonuclease YhaM